MGSARSEIEDLTIRKADAPRPTGKDRRRHTRFALGLPVGVQIAGRAEPITVELLDLSATGGRFRSLGDRVPVDETATVVFLLDDQRRCMAEGRVVRSDASGEFAVVLKKGNPAFAAFIRRLAE